MVILKFLFMYLFYVNVNYNVSILVLIFKDICINSENVLCLCKLLCVYSYYVIFCRYWLIKILISVELYVFFY